MSHRDGAVLISGDGIAASCCEALLRRARIEVFRRKTVRRKVPAVMLGDTAQKLLTDVTGRRDLFEGLPRIRKRVTAWGKESSQPSTFPHSAVVVSEEELLRRIRVETPESPHPEDRQPEWTFYTSPPLREATATHQFGSRIATAEAVCLKSGCDREACWVESVEDGWLFLLPNANDTGWVLSVAASARSLLEQSRLIADQVSESTGAGGSFPAHPRMADPLGGPGWFACGAAALGFDPLCGDGLGNAVREAILACAAVTAIRSGSDSNDVVAHYRARLLAGFKRHLEVCREFYSAGSSGPWWDAEMELLNTGLASLSRRMPEPLKSQFRLNGFALEPVVSGFP